MLLPQFRQIIGLVCSLRSLIKRQDAECANAEQIFATFLYLFAFCFATAPRIFAISLSKDKCSYRNFAKLSAWFVRFAHLSKDKTQIVRMPSRFLRRSYICLLFALVRKKSATGADFCIELLCFLRLDFLKSRFQFKARDVADVAYHFRFVSVNGVCKRDLRAEFYL